MSHGVEAAQARARARTDAAKEEARAAKERAAARLSLFAERREQELVKAKQSNRWTTVSGDGDDRSLTPTSTC